MEEVMVDALEWGGDGRAYHRSQPFTGVAIECYPDGSSKRQESFANGILHGKTIAYDRSGTIVLECFYCENQTHGLYFEKSLDRDQITEGEYEHGICLSRWVSGEEGYRSKVYDINEHPEALQTLALMRAAQVARKHRCIV